MTAPLRLAGTLTLLALLQACAPGPVTSGYPSGSSTYTAAAEERPKTPGELRAELLVLEQQAPGDYLTVEGTYRRNLIDQLVLEGDIVSKATLATYKDPQLLVTWYTKTQTELGTVRYPVYELLEPHGSAHFKLKTAAPGEVASVAMSVSEATPVGEN